MYRNEGALGKALSSYWRPGSIGPSILWSNDENFTNRLAVFDPSPWSVIFPHQDHEHPFLSEITYSSTFLVYMQVSPCFDTTVEISIIHQLVLTQGSPAVEFFRLVTPISWRSQDMYTAQYKLICTDIPRLSILCCCIKLSDDYWLWCWNAVPTSPLAWSQLVTGYYDFYPGSSKPPKIFDSHGTASTSLHCYAVKAHHYSYIRPQFIPTDCRRSGVMQKGFRPCVSGAGPGRGGGSPAGHIHLIDRTDNASHTVGSRGRSFQSATRGDGRDSRFRPAALTYVHRSQIPRRLGANGDNHFTL